MKINPALILYILVIGLFSLQAQAAIAAPDDAQTLVVERSNALMDALKEKNAEIKLDNKVAYQLVEDHILPHVDFNRVSRLVLGKHWRRADKAQRERFINEFRGFLVRTYVTAMVEFSDQIISHSNNIKYLPFRNESADDVSVRMMISQQDRPPVQVTYSLFQKTPTSNWMIYDLAVEGISLATTYRSSFSTQIRRGGLDALIDKLAARNVKADKTVVSTNGGPAK